MANLTPTAKEAAAIAALKKVAKTWPKTLWLFSASGSLMVMRADDNRSHHMTPGGYVDQAYILDQINIPNDGGDW